jgi:hypothetical protein
LIEVGGRQRFIGYFTTEDAAARAVDEETKRLYVNPVLNLLPDGSPNPHRKQRIHPQSMIIRQRAAQEQEEAGGNSISSSEGEAEGKGGGGGGRERATGFRGGYGEMGAGE